MTSKLDPFERPAEFRDFPEAPYHPRFIEKLLLAIIDAYPSENLPESADLEKVRQRRLRAAIKALFGHSPRPGPINANDLLALTTMAKQVMLDRTVADWAEATGAAGVLTERSKIPGDRTLARERAHPKDSNAEDRLRMSFRKHRAYFQSIGTHEFHVEEHDMLDDLNEVYRIFRKYNIDLSIDTTKLGMLSFAIQSISRSGA